MASTEEHPQGASCALHWERFPCTVPIIIEFIFTIAADPQAAEYASLWNQVRTKETFDHWEKLVLFVTKSVRSKLEFSIRLSEYDRAAADADRDLSSGRQPGVRGMLTLRMHTELLQLEWFRDLRT